MAKVFLLVGLPGAGKTTRARQLAAEHAALRLTPDEWMIPLFDDNDADGRRDVLEGRLITVAVQLVRLQTSVVLDFGCWSRDERSALRSIFEAESAEFRLVYLAIDRAAQLERITHRWAATPHDTFPMTAADVDHWRTLFEAPDATELACTAPLDPPPTTASDWLDWARTRWPSLSIA